MEQKIEIKGEYGNFIKLHIDKIYGFPEDTSYFGGYETTSFVDIKVSNYIAKGNIWITTGDIYNFYVDLQKCQNLLKGIARLISYENNLSIQLEYNEIGHVIISGSFQEKHDERNVLNFEFSSDQTFMNSLLIDLYNIHQQYGDFRGLSKV